MRPHLVKRMVLDGVSNAESYHNDIFQWGRDGLTDTHKANLAIASAATHPNAAPYRHSPAS